MNRLYFYYLNIIRPEFLLKYSIKNAYTLLYVDSIEIFILLSDLKVEEDLSIIKSFFILEFLSLQKAFIKKFFIGSKQGSKSNVFLLKSSLRKFTLFNFLDYFVNFGLPFFENRQLFLKAFFDENKSFCVYIRDLYVFYKFPENLLSFNKGFFFILRFSKNVFEAKIISNFLKQFNFFFKKQII